MRFCVQNNQTHDMIEIWDYNLSQPATSGGLPMVFDSMAKAKEVEEVLNQRVIFPELTRADGKLVSV